MRVHYLTKKITQQVHGADAAPLLSHAKKNNLRQASSHVVSTLHGRYSVLGLGIGIWVTPC